MYLPVQGLPVGKLPPPDPPQHSQPAHKAVSVYQPLLMVGDNHENAAIRLDSEENFSQSLKGRNINPPQGGLLMLPALQTTSPSLL